MENRASRRREERSSVPIHEREKRLALKSETGSTTAIAAQEALGLPDDVRGLTVVDLASGSSSLVAVLLERGANAYGVDRLYYNDALLENVTNRGMQIITQRLTRMRQEELLKGIRESLRIFRKSYREQPDRYIPGWLTDTDLPDNFADITVSLHGLSDLGADPAVMLAGVREALRITKPGGPFILCPFHHQQSSDSRFASGHERVLKTLRLEGYEVILERVRPGADMVRMRALKKG